MKRLGRLIARNKVASIVILAAALMAAGVPAPLANALATLGANAAAESIQAEPQPIDLPEEP